MISVSPLVKLQARTMRPYKREAVKTPVAGRQHIQGWEKPWIDHHLWGEPWKPFGGIEGDSNERCSTCNHWGKTRPRSLVTCNALSLKTVMYSKACLYGAEYGGSTSTPCWPQVLAVLAPVSVLASVLLPPCCSTPMIADTLDWGPRQHCSLWVQTGCAWTRWSLRTRIPTKQTNPNIQVKFTWI